MNRRGFIAWAGAMPLFKKNVIASSIPQQSTNAFSEADHQAFLDAMLTGYGAIRVTVGNIQRVDYQRFFT